MPAKRKNNVAIIDFMLGNLFSVKNACEFVGLNPTITSDKDEILNSDAAILPGVGAFGDAMNNLNQLDLIPTIKQFVATGKPFMGICLGFQLLFSESEEFGSFSGLDIIEGKVKKFHNINDDGVKIPVPQIGWNHIHRSKYFDDNKWDKSPLYNIPDKEFMYFVHSYYVIPKDKNIILTTTNYEGLEYCSSVFIDNIFACQFHPEKSAKAGIQIYKNWSNMVKRYSLEVNR